MAVFHARRGLITLTLVSGALFKWRLHHHSILYQIIRCKRPRKLIPQTHRRLPFMASGCAPSTGAPDSPPLWTNPSQSLRMLFRYPTRGTKKMRLQPTMRSLRWARFVRTTTRRRVLRCDKMPQTLRHEPQTLRHGPETLRHEPETIQPLPCRLKTSLRCRDHKCTSCTRG